LSYGHHFKTKFSLHNKILTAQALVTVGIL